MYNPLNACYIIYKHNINIGLHYVFIVCKIFIYFLTCLSRSLTAYKFIDKSFYEQLLQVMQQYQNHSILAYFLSL